MWAQFCIILLMCSYSDALSIENALIFLPPIKTLVPKMHLLEFETVPLSLYSSNNVCGAGSLSTSKMAPYQVLTFKTSTNPLRVCIRGKFLQRPSLAKQTRLHQISRPQCSSGWYQAFTWTSVLLLAALDSWLCPKDNPRTPSVSRCPQLPIWGHWAGASATARVLTMTRKWL